MSHLPEAKELPDGSLRVPNETRELLYRVLGDVWQTLAFEQYQPMTPGAIEGQAVRELQRLLHAKEFGPLRPLHVILELPPPIGFALSPVK